MPRLDETARQGREAPQINLHARSAVVRNFVAAALHSTGWYERTPRSVGNAGSEVGRSRRTYFLNCAVSVDSSMAKVDEEPPVMTLETSSK